MDLARNAAFTKLESLGPCMVLCFARSQNFTGSPCRFPQPEDNWTEHYRPICKKCRTTHRVNTIEHFEMATSYTSMCNLELIFQVERMSGSVVISLHDLKLYAKVIELYSSLTAVDPSRCAGAGRSCSALVCAGYFTPASSMAWQRVLAAQRVAMNNCLKIPDRHLWFSSLPESSCKLVNDY